MKLVKLGKNVTLEALFLTPNLFSLVSLSKSSQLLRKFIDFILHSSTKPGLYIVLYSLYARLCVYFSPTLSKVQSILNRTA